MSVLGRTSLQLEVLFEKILDHDLPLFLYVFVIEGAVVIYATVIGEQEAEELVTNGPLEAAVNLLLEHVLKADVLPVDRGATALLL